MDATSTALSELFDRIPRRHTLDNVKEINEIVTQYEDILISIEGINSFYETNIPPFFDALEPIQASIKKSTDNKASKKVKDDYFDEASGQLKDTMQELINLYGEGNSVE